MDRRLPLIIVTFLIALAVRAQAARREISEDRDLKEIDLTGWNCLNRPEGSARTPDGVERNHLKNRSAADISALQLQDLTAATFLQAVAEFEAQTKGTRRKDLSPAQKQQLEPLEKQIVQFTGYLVVAYCGPPETTNCASVDFHDWHLEVFEKPADHPPQPGDPTPVICEITPRTQNAIYNDKIRIQELTAFFRRPDLTYEPTGHKAHKIRVIGYRMWDDEHNGRFDVGPTVRSVGANQYHNPWRSTAWEIHPVLQIVPLDGTSTAVAPLSSPPAQQVPPASPQASVSPVPAEKTPLPAPSATVRPQVVTLTQAVKIKIP